MVAATTTRTGPETKIHRTVAATTIMTRTGPETTITTPTKEHRTVAATTITTRTGREIREDRMVAATTTRTGLETIAPTRTGHPETRALVIRVATSTKVSNSLLRRPDIIS